MYSTVHIFKIFRHALKIVFVNDPIVINSCIHTGP